jgi:hypothetical protein
MLSSEMLREELERHRQRVVADTVAALLPALQPDETLRCRLFEQYAHQLVDLRGEVVTALAARDEAVRERDLLVRAAAAPCGVKGTAFERSVAEQIAQYHPHVAVEDVSKQPSAMDLRLELPLPGGGRLRIGVDAKDRKTTPPHADLLKFQRDMEAQGYDGGVLVLRGRTALQPTWELVSDDLIRMTGTQYCVTNFERAPWLLGTALNEIRVALAVGAPPRDAAAVNAVIRAVAEPLRECLQLATTVRDSATAFMRRAADHHVQQITIAGQAAHDAHPDLALVDLTTVLQSQPLLRGKRAR